MTGKTKCPEPRTVDAVGAKGDEIADVVDNSVATDIKSCDELRFTAWVRWCKYCDSSFLDTYGPYGDMCPRCREWLWGKVYNNGLGREHER